jgi:hypothetical protein
MANPNMAPGVTAGMPVKLRRRLSGVTVDDISIVDKPAVPEARFVLVKRDTEEGSAARQELRKSLDALSKRMVYRNKAVPQANIPRGKPPQGHSPVAGTLAQSPEMTPEAHVMSLMDMIDDLPEDALQHVTALADAAGLEVGDIPSVAEQGSGLTSDPGTDGDGAPATGPSPVSNANWFQNLPPEVQEALAGIADHVIDAHSAGGNAPQLGAEGEDMPVGAKPGADKLPVGTDEHPEDAPTGTANTKPGPDGKMPHYLSPGASPAAKPETSDNPGLKKPKKPAPGGINKDVDPDRDIPPGASGYRSLYATHTNKDVDPSRDVPRQNPHDTRRPGEVPNAPAGQVRHDVAGGGFDNPEHLFGDLEKAHKTAMANMQAQYHKHMAMMHKAMAKGFAGSPKPLDGESLEGDLEPEEEGGKGPAVGKKKRNTEPDYPGDKDDDERGVLETLDNELEKRDSEQNDELLDAALERAAKVFNRVVERVENVDTRLKVACGECP